MMIMERNERERNNEGKEIMEYEDEGTKKQEH